MDFVPNHTSERHPYFVDATARGTDSPYYTFYDRDAGGNPTHYFSWTHLPNLNYDNPEVRRFILEAFSFWVREYDVDGFRVDVAWGLKDRAPDYWPIVATELNRIKADILLIAEASARDDYYYDHGYAAAYDWTDELGQWAWAEPLGGIDPVGKAMTAVLTANKPDHLVFRFLNNNDTGARFITTYGVGFYRAAAAMLLTLPGLPCLYTGDEVGAEFEPYGTPGPIDMSDHHGLRPVFQELIHLRRKTPAIWSRAWAPLDAAPAATTFAYLRGDDTTGKAIVVLNFSPTDTNVVVTVPEPLPGLVDLRSGVPVTSQSPTTLTLSVPAWDVRILGSA
jgi:glycosidase